MKKVYTFFFAVLVTAIGFAQTPQKMSYQAVVRNAIGELVKSSPIGMKISILQGSATGTPVYVETQIPTTNSSGLASLEIGGGIAVTGTFATIDWSTGTYFIKTETDPTGGTSYTITGTSQLLSVPYALFAKNTANDSTDKAYVDALRQRVWDLEDVVFTQLPLPTNGLVAYYPFNGNANDASGNGYNGTVTGATLTTNRFGITSSAYHFNGNHYISTAYAGIQGNADRAISFWVKINPQETGGFVSSYGGGLGTSFNPGVFPEFSAHLDISNATVSYKSSKVNDGIWHHFVYIFSTQYGTSLNGVRIFQDGVLLTEIAGSYNYNLYTINTGSTLPFMIGSTGGTFLSIDDIRFYNRVLTYSEIQLLYHEGGYPNKLVTDVDGNSYKTVKIGTQVWMAENLKSTKYNNGDAIPNVTNNVAWIGLTTGAYCDYNNTPSNSNIYGKLYNFYAVSDSRKVCPTGWHVPTDAEWTTLIDYLGGESVAGGKLKEAGTTHWSSPNLGATNETGFTALPGGYRWTNGAFSDIGGNNPWWTATEYLTSSAYNRRVYYLYGDVLKYFYDKLVGFSVRCLKN